MDPLVNTDEAPKGAMYGQITCPNAPNACYCTGACQRPKPTLLNVRHCQFALGVCDCNGGICTKAQRKLPRFIWPPKPAMPEPSFVEEHNRQKHVNTQQEARDKANELAEELLWRKHGIVSAKPEDYYNGTATLDNMIATYGKDETRLWCVMTAHKYIERMGLKEGNPLEQEKQKCLWYLATAERLYKELQAELA